MSNPRFDKNWDDLAHKLGYRDKRDMLEEMYVVKGFSLNQIGERLDCSPHCVGRNLKREGIDRRGKGGRNNHSGQTRKLFRLDQRVVLDSPFLLVARETHVSTALLYRYRTHMRVKEDAKWNSQSLPQSSD